MTVVDPKVGFKEKSETKTARIPIKIIPVALADRLKKPEWIRVKAGSPSTRFYEIKKILRDANLHTVCEEASCPNIGECFGKGTATFMIMGDLCTRRCPFCDVGHGRPLPLDTDEPRHLAETIAKRSAFATSAVKMMINASDGEDGPRALEALGGIAVAHSTELKAGLAAFAAKKKG